MIVARLLLFFSIQGIPNSFSPLAWFQLPEHRIQMNTDLFHRMSKSASHPLRRELKICQNTLQALTDKNHNPFQELWTVFWFPKRKPKPVEL